LLGGEINGEKKNPGFFAFFRLVEMTQMLIPQGFKITRKAKSEIKTHTPPAPPMRACAYARTHAWGGVRAHGVRA